MVKVITYGTYDMLHYGHIRLLERAKALGDYLIVGVTSDDYDKTRGKINNQQSLMDRISSVENLGIADEVIVEEYEGQKIDDIKRYDIDIFTVGSDWEGYFDYLKEFCKVVYLPRTEGVSSTEIRSESRSVEIGIVGSVESLIDKFIRESNYVNGLRIGSTFSGKKMDRIYNEVDNYEELLKNHDAVYIVSPPKTHFEYIQRAIECGKHVLCEAPLTLSRKQTQDLFIQAKQKNVVLMEGMKTAYATAYQRMLLLIKSGVIGRVVSIDSSCTSLNTNLSDGWDGFSYWGPTALLPAFQIFGMDYLSKQIAVKSQNDNNVFSKVNMVFPNGVATIKAGCGVKSEGDLIISGTRGYIYVPSPWWKTDYFEVRYENPAENKRYFYQLNGEGIRYEMVAFLESISRIHKTLLMDEKISCQIASVIEDFMRGTDRYDMTLGG